MHTFVCDKCGKVLKDKSFYQLSIDHIDGFLQAHPIVSERNSIDLCEDCYKEIAFWEKQK